MIRASQLPNLLQEVKNVPRNTPKYTFIDFVTSPSKSPTLIAELDTLAAELETNRSVVIRMLLREALNARKKAQGVGNAAA
jgi:hypothetical protein